MIYVCFLGYRAKLSDFGLTPLLTPTPPPTKGGAIRWMPPEMAQYLHKEPARALGSA